MALLLLQTEAMVTETIRQRGDWVQAVAEVDIDLRGLRELPVELANFEFSTENMIGGKFCVGEKFDSTILRRYNVCETIMTR